MAAKKFKATKHRATKSAPERFSIRVDLINPLDDEGEPGVFDSAEFGVYFSTQALADEAVAAYTDTMGKHEAKVAEQAAKKE